jgi:hypothetical protein
MDRNSPLNEINADAVINGSSNLATKRLSNDDNFFDSSV